MFMHFIAHYLEFEGARFIINCFETCKTCMKMHEKHSEPSASISKDIIQYSFHIHLGFKSI